MEFPRMHTREENGLKFLKLIVVMNGNVYVYSVQNKKPRRRRPVFVGRRSDYAHCSPHQINHLLTSSADYVAGFRVYFLEENYKPGKKRFLFSNAIPQPYDLNGFPSNYATQSNDAETGNNTILQMEQNIIRNLTYYDESDCIESEFYREDHIGNDVNNFKSPRKSSRFTRNNEDMRNKNMPFAEKKVPILQLRRAMADIKRNRQHGLKTIRNFKYYEAINCMHCITRYS